MQVPFKDPFTLKCIYFLHWSIHTMHIFIYFFKKAGDIRLCNPYFFFLTVGYIVGLGDRHVQNILIDEETSELVHIDLGEGFFFFFIRV